MDDMTDDEWYESIRDFVENEDNSFPELDDLPKWWDGINSNLRDGLVASYYNFAFTKRWAWDGLDRLHKVLMERREYSSIPERLQFHVNLAYAGLRRPPNKPRNPRYAPKDDRDFRIMRVYNVLLEDGVSEKRVKEEIMTALDHIDDDTIRSVFRKMENFHPLKSVTKKEK